MSQVESRQNNLKLLYTGLIFLNNIAYGISLNILGATLVDVSFVYQTTIETASSLGIAFWIGYMLGSFVSFTYVWVNRQLFVAFIVLLLSLTLGCLPFYGIFWCAMGAMVISGIGGGAWDSATSLWLVELWPVQNSAILQGNQFMYGVGAILAPILASPFLFGTKTQMSTGIGNETRPITIDDRIDALKVPFVLNGVLQGIVPIIFVLTYFICPYVKTTVRPTEKLAIHLKGAAKPKIPFRKIKLTLIGLCLGVHLAAQVGFFTFAPSMFQFLAIKLSASEAARVQSVMFTGFTLARLATAFISLKVQIDIILGYNFAIQLASIILLYFCQNNLLLIYVGMVGIGFGFSTIWPAIFAFTEQFLGLTDRICSLYTFLVGIMCLVTPFILSQGFKENPVVLMYITGIFVSTSSSLFASCRLWIALNQRQAKLEKAKEKNNFGLKEINNN